MSRETQKRNSRQKCRRHATLANRSGISGGTTMELKLSRSTILRSAIAALLLPAAAAAQQPAQPQPDTRRRDHRHGHAHHPLRHGHPGAHHGRASERAPEHVGRPVVRLADSVAAVLREPGARASQRRPELRRLESESARRGLEPHARAARRPAHRADEPLRRRRRRDVPRGAHEQRRGRHGRRLRQLRHRRRRGRRQLQARHGFRRLQRPRADGRDHLRRRRLVRSRLRIRRRRRRERPSDRLDRDVQRRSHQRLRRDGGALVLQQRRARHESGHHGAREPRVAERAARRTGIKPA